MDNACNVNAIHDDDNDDSEDGVWTVKRSKKKKKGAKVTFEDSGKHEVLSKGSN